MRLCSPRCAAPIFTVPTGPAAVIVNATCLPHSSADRRSEAPRRLPLRSIPPLPSAADDLRHARGKGLARGPGNLVESSSTALMLRVVTRCEAVWASIMPAPSAAPIRTTPMVCPSVLPHREYFAVRFAAVLVRCTAALGVTLRVRHVFHVIVVTPRCSIGTDCTAAARINCRRRSPSLGEAADPCRTKRSHPAACSTVWSATRSRSIKVRCQQRCRRPLAGDLDRRAGPDRRAHEQADDAMPSPLGEDAVRHRLRRR